MITKYQMENLSLHEKIREKLDFFHKNNQIPNIIFHGSSGTGKKSILYEFLSKIYEYNKHKIKHNVMVVNCSHGKGIKFIREELKFFAKTNIQSNYGVTFKSIVLINADSLTTDAQSALRRCIELFSYNTRFFIVVENKHKLLNPILSRFCEIYFPEYVNERGEIENLHRVKLMRKFEIPETTNDKLEVISAMLRDIDVYSDHKMLADISTKIYDNGYSCLDLMEVIEKINITNIHTLYMKFNKVKSEFRCEKLLILYMLNEIYGEPRFPRTPPPSSITAVVNVLSCPH